MRQLSPETKILYMSGYTGTVIMQAGIFETNAIFLEKPFTQTDLLNKVQEVLG
jgi:FixJ family two-component response regulator